MKKLLDIQGVQVPIKIRRHWKQSIRYSISKKSINLSLPKYYRDNTIAIEIEKVKLWAEHQFVKNPKLIQRFEQKTYHTGDIILVCNEEFTIFIATDQKKTYRGKIVNHNINILTPDNQSNYLRNNQISSLLSRLFSKYFLAQIEERVKLYNQKYFDEIISSVRLKNNQSNWGSCSTKKNINLSSRLLLAPKEVQDYVIVHELAHLKEMNHSPRFWSIVEEIIPQYRQKEKWLRQNGVKLKF